jgi:uncharacterized repeat protein (TIGR03803 family)
MKHLYKLVLAILVLFTFHANSQHSIITSFTGSPTGYSPRGSLVSDGIYMYGMTTNGGSNGYGTIFKIQISNNAFTKIYDFDGSNGYMPYGSLISDGVYLYGMTLLGGANGVGIIFKMQISNNAFTKIFDFTQADGTLPFGSLTKDGDYLYGMTSQGGTNNYGTIFKIQISNNVFTKIFDFNRTTSGMNPNGSLISDGTFLYGMVPYGGANDKGILFKIQISNNAFTKILDFDGSNGSNPGNSLISDGTYLYGATGSGGANSKGTIFKIQISNNAYTKIYDFNDSDGSVFSGNLVSDGTFLYGRTITGGANNCGTTFKIQISNNAYTKIYDFVIGAEANSRYCSLILDGTYLYGMTNASGINNVGIIFKLQTTNNTFTKLFDFVGAVDGAYPKSNSLIKVGNYLYGATPEGGINNYGILFKTNISNNEQTKILDFDNSTGTKPPGSLFSDGTYLYGITKNGGVNNYGTVFKVKISDNVFTKIYDFDEQSPCGSLISDGIFFYGMAYNSIFKIQISNNAFTKMHELTSTEGGFLQSSLVSDGTFLYGMATSGGANMNGTIFKIQISNNAFTKLFDFETNTSGSSPFGSLLLVGDYLYGMTSNGGVNNYGTLFKFQISNGTFTKILDFNSTDTGGNPCGSLISDGTFLYGLTNVGGTGKYGIIFKMDINTESFTKLLDFSGISNGASPQGTLLFDNGYLYGMTGAGGSNNIGTIFKYVISPNTAVISEPNPDNISIYSNQKLVYIKGSNLGSSNVVVLDLSGKEVYTKKLNSDFNFIDLSSKPGGIYIIKYSTEKIHKTQKVYISE